MESTDVKIVAVAAVSLAIAFAGAALAHSGATGIVKQRMDGMKSMSDAAKAIGAVKTGVLPYSPDLVRRAAGALRESGEAARGQFPAGSDDHPSEALPTVWSDREGFDRLLEALIDAAARLDAAAENESSAMTIADEVAATCKDCHAKYREKKL